MFFIINFMTCTGCLTAVRHGVEDVKGHKRFTMVSNVFITVKDVMLVEINFCISGNKQDILILCHRYAIIGVTEQYVNDKVDRDRYMDHVTQLKGHVSRLNHR
jgi:copper chaperone CopZ